MHITKTSLFSFIFMTHCILANTAEEVTKSIENELSNFNALLIATTKKIKLAEQQKNEDQKEYESYMAEQQRIKDNAEFWFYHQLDHSAPQIKNYKGNYIKGYYIYVTDEPCYDGTGSEGKYNTLRKILHHNEMGYTILKDNFKRGKRLNDINYLQELEKSIHTYAQNIQHELDQVTIPKP